MHRTFFFLIICILPQAILSATVISNNTLILQSIEDKSSTDVSPPEDIPCTCGVFLSSQFKKGSKDQPKGDPVLTQEIDAPFMNNAIGNKQCTHRCLEAGSGVHSKDFYVLCVGEFKGSYGFGINQIKCWLKGGLKRGHIYTDGMHGKDYEIFLSEFTLTNEKKFLYFRHIQIIKHLPKSSDIICATVDRDTVNREKAFLFVRNHSDKWHPTSFSAGREYCCKDHVPLKCTKSSK